MDAQILHRLDLNYCHANGAFFGTSRRGEVVENRDVYLTCCGAPAAEFNTAFLKAPIRDLGACLRRAARYFGEAKLPFRITLRDALVAACSEGLGRAGFREVARMPGMCLRPLPDRPKPHPELRVRPVETPADLAHFQATAFAGFGLPAASGAHYLTEELRARPNVRLYLGTLGDRPVCTSALVVTDAVAGIYWVATLEAYRGRGLGEAITWAAIEGGRAAGCDVAGLQASESGRAVYERMGFETPLHYVHFQAGGPP